ncbi:hypothetical protein QL285_059500 [Trifolium repens]|nr:hypothetical protein QL285_059500 [Trifolium repens]
MDPSQHDGLLRPITKTINRAPIPHYFSFRNSRTLSTIKRGVHRSSKGLAFSPYGKVMSARYVLFRLLCLDYFCNLNYVSLLYVIDALGCGGEDELPYEYLESVIESKL